MDGDGVIALSASNRAAAETDLTDAADRPASPEMPMRGMPAEMPGDMPRQSLWRFRRRNRRRFIDAGRSRSSLTRRFAVLGSAMLLAAFAVYEMEQVLEVGGRDRRLWRRDRAPQPRPPHAGRAARLAHGLPDADL